MKNLTREGLGTRLDIPTSFMKSMLDYLNINVAWISTCKLSFPLFLFVHFLYLVYHPYIFLFYTCKQHISMQCHVCQKKHDHHALMYFNRHLWLYAPRVLLCSHAWQALLTMTSSN